MTTAIQRTKRTKATAVVTISRVPSEELPACRTETMIDNSAGAIVSAETAKKKYIGRRSRSAGHDMLSPINWIPLVPE